MKPYMIVLLLMMFVPASLLYPASGTLTLLDQSTLSPIAGATYHAGGKYGVSDSHGMLEFEYSQSDTLFISHTSYGQWSLSGSELLSALGSGFIYREMVVLQLQPMTLITVHPNLPAEQRVDLEAQDKLAHDGAAVLTKKPLLGSIRKGGNYGFDPVMRGFKYDQLNIVIDGVQSAIAACPNRMDPPTSQVAPNMVGHVEIFKGPHSFRYGTAFGGTVNFVSATPKFSREARNYGRWSNSAEGNGGIYRTEGVLGTSGKYYDLSLFGSYSRGNQYSTGSHIEIPAGFQRGSVGANIGLRLSSGQSLRMSVTRNIARDTDFPALPMDLRRDNTSLFNLQHNSLFDGEHLVSWNTTAYFSRVKHTMDNYTKQLDPRMVDARTDARTKSLGGRTEGIWNIGNGVLYTGFDLKVETAEGERERQFLMGPRKGQAAYDNVWNGGRIARTGMFGEYHHFLSSVKLVLSGRLEYNDAKAGEPDLSFVEKNPVISTDPQINPNFSAGVQRSFKKNYSAGVWYGRAQRSGGIAERFINSFPIGLDRYDMLGNPQLKPEVNNQMDIILGYNNGRSRLELDIFASVLRDYISSEIDTSLAPSMPSSPGVRRFVNIEKAVMTGFEISWQQKLPAGLQHNADLAFTYGQDRVAGQPLPEIAPLDFRYTLSGSFQSSRLRPSATFRHVLKQNRVSGNFGETATPSFSIVDLACTYRIDKQWSASFGVQNLFDTLYYEHLSRSLSGQSQPIYSPGRNFYLSVFLDVM